MASKFVVFCSILTIARAGVLTPLRYTASPTVAVAQKVAYAYPAVDAVASTQQNVVRSFGGTVSSYSKAVDTPYSSVRKEDTRISNNVYAPAYERTLTYAAAPTPVTFTKTVAFDAAPVVERHAYAAYAAPVVKSLTYAAPAPVVQKAAVTYTAPVPVVSRAVYKAPATAAYVHSAASNDEIYAHALSKTVTAAVPSYAVAKPVATYTATAPVTTTTSYNHGPAAITYKHNAPGVTGYGSSQTVHYSPAEMVSHMSFDGFGTHWEY